MNTLFDGLLDKADLQREFAKIPNGRVFTYHDVLEASSRYSNVLVDWGVGPGDRVAVQVPKSIEAIILYLATIRIGAVFLPLNTAYTPTEIEYFLGNASPHVFICDPEKLDAYRDITAGLNICLETLGIWNNAEISAGSLADAGAAASADFDTVPRNAGDLAAILYTSGTTGLSKGAMLSHGNLLSNAQVLKEYWRFSESDVLLHALPIFHTHGLFVAINLTLISAASMILLPGFTNDAMIDNLPQSTCLMGVPTFYTRLLDDRRFDKFLVSHMRLFISGSAPLLTDTHNRFEQVTGHRILERYGMTETNMNTSNPYDGERRAGTVGFPLPGTHLRVVDADTGASLKDGEVGIIEVAGHNVFSGYWQMPEKTKQEFRKDGYFITGDMGVIDKDGYVQIVGRSKDLIISGGYNIYPKEVELLLDEQDGVYESAVIGLPHPDLGEGVVGVLVAKKNRVLDEKAILENMAINMARFKQPRRLLVVDELPRNTMGKVQKNILRDSHAALFADKQQG